MQKGNPVGAVSRKGAEVAKPRPFYQQPMALLALVLGLTFGVLAPSLRNDFMATWDDGLYVTDNTTIRHLDGAAVREMFTTPVNATYVPIPLLTFALEYKFFGLKPLPYHFDNLVLHLLCVALVFLILGRLGLEPAAAAFGALIFGIHPMHVESVAWVTERKDLVYSLFYLGALAAYILGWQKEEARRRWNALAMVCFVFALFSKIQAVTLPLSLLAVDFYFKRPMNWRLAATKIPYFALSLLFGVAGVLILKKEDALEVHLYNLWERSMFGGYAWCAYVVKFLVPRPLSALYPYPAKGHELSWWCYASLAAILVAGWFIAGNARKNRVWAFGFLFFTVNIAFLLQVVGAGTGFLSDRFTYIPYLGLCFIAGWAVQEGGRNKDWRGAMQVAAVVAIVGLGSIAYGRCQVWKNGEVFWTQAMEHYSGYTPFENRAAYYKAQGLMDQALTDYSRAIAMNPADAEAIKSRGKIYFDRGQDEPAYADYRRALDLKSTNAEIYASLGAIAGRRHEFDAALQNLDRAVAMNSKAASTYINRALVYESLGRVDECIGDLKRALTLMPDDDSRVCLSTILKIATLEQKKKNWAESISWLDRAIAKKPEKEFFKLRAESWSGLGEKEKAAADLGRGR